MSARSVAIVTGASSGIGMATAMALAKRRYVVVLAARRRRRLEEVASRCGALGGQGEVVVTDVAEAGQVDALVSGTLDRFGRLDVMVNNAGFGQFARVHEVTPQEMREIFDVNFFGVFYGCRAAAPVMMRQRSGHIFNVSSVIGKRGVPFYGAYCATKFAVCGLTDSLRVELAGYGVRVTSVCPALVATEFSTHVRRAYEGRSKYRKTKGLTRPGLIGEKIAATVGKPTGELVFTAGGKFLTLVAALWPRAADAMMKLFYNDTVRDLRRIRE